MRVLSVHKGERGAQRFGCDMRQCRLLPDQRHQIPRTAKLVDMPASAGQGSVDAVRHCAGIRNRQEKESSRLEHPSDFLQRLPKAAEMFKAVIADHRIENRRVERERCGIALHSLKVTAGQ